GQTVHVFVDSSYTADPNYVPNWVAFLSRLPHGAEISKVTFYFAPLTRVRQFCGQGTLACFSSRDEVIMSTGDDIPDRATKESVVSHEYGHHIAYNSDNAPWAAIDYGTKRWATYMGVCAKQKAGTLFPGDESEHYRLNPGEAFAEDFRVSVEHTLGI